MTSLSSYPARVPFVNRDGTLSPDAVRWLQRQVVRQVGGATALTNAELTALVQSLSSSVETLMAGVAGLTEQVNTLNDEFAVVGVEEIFQPSAAQDLGEMIFQN
jgi:hypothetical protein